MTVAGDHGLSIAEQALRDLRALGLGPGPDNGSAPVTGDPEDTWRPLDLTTVDEGEPARPSILAAADGLGLFYPGRRHLVTGKPETAKSWMGLAACLDVISRLGLVAVYIDFDLMGAADARARMLALGATPGDLARFWYVEPDRPFDAAAERWWNGALATGSVGLAWLDAQNPGLELHGLKPNSEEDVARFQRLIVGRFHRAGAATVVVDHLPKDPDAPAEYAINSQRKLAGVDVHLRLELAGEPLQRGGKPTSVVVKVMKDRPGGFNRSASKTAARLLLTPGADGSLVVEVENGPGAGGKTGTMHPSFRPTHLMERTSLFLEGEPEPVSQTTVESGVKGNRDAKRVALRVLIDEGYVARERAGQAWMHRSQRPYREAADPASDKYEPAMQEGTE